MNLPCVWYKNLGGTFVRFVAIHACDGQTDTFAVGKTALHVCSAVKTGNQLKIHLVHLLADENEYCDDSFVVVLSQRRLACLGGSVG